MTTSDALERARASFATRCWGDAHKQFAAAEAKTPLDLDDLEKLAIAAYMSGDDERSTLAWTRAHHEAIRRDDPRRAARNAVAIGSGLLFRGETAPAMGWFARAARVLEGCDDCPEREWVLTWKAWVQLWAGDPQSALPVFAEGVAVGRRCNDSDLVTMSGLGQGMCLLVQGKSSPGLSLLDEVMVGVTSGEVSPMYSGIAYCTVIAGCSEVFDLQRARQWTAALTRWCGSQRDLVPYEGNCLVHRCELMKLEGAWNDALEVAQRACDHLSGPVKWDTLGSAYYQLADPAVLRQRLVGAGLTDVTVDTSNQERVSVRTGQQLWDWTLGGNPVPSMLVADLSDRQRDDVIRVLDGMVRERSGGNGVAVLTAPLNIGVGVK